MAPNTPRKPSVAALLGLLVGLALGVLLTTLGALAVLGELRLRAGGSTAVATVRDTRVMRSTRSPDSFEVLYQFTLPGSAVVYSQRDETGRTNLWASLPEGDWQVAKKTKTLAVSYLPEDPWNNRPLRSAAMPLGDPIAGMVLGLVFAVPCLLLTVGWLKRRSAVSGGVRA
jgi:hypothetical protein